MTEKRPLTVVKREDLTPICPHCEKRLDEVYIKSRGTGIVFGRSAVYFCPHCSKVLGFGYGKMIS